MALHKITKGLHLPIKGEPDQVVHPATHVRCVALVAADYVGMKPTMHVSVGDEVKRGQLLFEDKKTPGVRHVAPGAGRIAAINRGARRALQSVVIALNDREIAGEPSSEDRVTFESYTGEGIEGLSADRIEALLLESGLWTAFRTRPFSRAPMPGTRPRAIFITAMDTNPLAASVDAVLAGREEDLETGFLCMAKLAERNVYLCQAPGAKLTPPTHGGIQVEEFQGPHPAGDVGVHIHQLDPVHRDKVVWHLDCRDVAAIGLLIRTGQLDVDRVISFAGPSVKNPRLIKTRLGACIAELTEGELIEGEHRLISGSVFSGRNASDGVYAFLGRFHRQVSVLPEGREREFLGWMAPGANRFSTINTFLGCVFRGKKRFDFTTALNGGRRAIVPIGMYERVLPMDILPTFLLRALAAGDLERAEELGCLELDEEDLALCTFVCPSKIEYGPVLRESLTQIEKEG
ncbi:MAG: Na(+)-translocating NADH-quinone reductase subunit A [Nitrospiraceae bacterium]|nr:Na(+)-translocating NADH-quinone reductase subunit A [Nitrospiraceae bacterium]